ncbi:MAG TPA: transposase [Candidatus Dormibacteraeota bacterium]|nr:transposase [Candidatus Dormibacteraeota bacterium]
MAIPLLQTAERQCPRKGRGDKVTFPESLMAALIMIAVLKKKKTKSAQYRFLSERWEDIAPWLGTKEFPSRSTYFRRYRGAHHLYRQAIRLQGTKAIAEGVADPRQVAVDKSLISGHGPAWHKQDRQSGKIPVGVDCDCAWGYSEHNGWVHGYSYEVIVCATAGTTVFPLTASVATASACETKTCPDKIDDLPEATEAVLADSAYDANALAERVEYDAEQKWTGRHFLCPENPRNNKRLKTKPGHADASRARSRERRRQRKQFLESRRGRRLYARRKKTVEPFNQWFKSMFELEGRVWHRGLENNGTQLLAAIFIYQLLIRYNFAHGNNNGQVRWLMDSL